MHFYKTVEVPAKTKQDLDYVACDLCGDKSNNYGYWQPDVEVEVLMKTEDFSNHPDDYKSKTMAWDICPACFKNKLVPWLISQGATPTETEI